MEKIERRVKILPADSLSEEEELKAYRKACLAMSPNERVEAMRQLSFRLATLNPKNTRTRHIEKGIVQIIHDAI